MSYTIDYLTDDRVTGSEHWTDSLELARDLAKESVASGTADRVEIRDESGALVFHHPRITRHA